MDEGKFMAGVDLCRRMGAAYFRVGYTPEEDGEPVVWYATAAFKDGHDAGAGMSPQAAVMRLVYQLCDGGHCTHCKRPTGVVDDDQASDMPLNDLICWYAYDPEVKTFRRSCEGAT